MLCCLHTSCHVVINHSADVEKKDSEDTLLVIAAM